MRFRWFIIALVVMVSVYALIKPPQDQDGRWNVSSWSQNIKDNIKLGLDLQGGIFMQLEVDVEDAVNQHLEEQAGTIKANLEGDNKFTIFSAAADLEANTITFKNVTSSEYDDVLGEVKDLYRGSWDVSQRGEDIVFTLTNNARITTQNNAVDQTVYKIQNRVDELGVTEPVINRMVGSNRIVLELAGADDVTRVHKIVREPGKLEWRLKVKGSQAAPSREALMGAYGGQIPAGKKIFPQYTPVSNVATYYLLEEVMMTAGNVDDVFPTQDSRGMPAVGITLDREGGQIFDAKSAVNIGNQLAIVLDGKIISIPTIQSRLAQRFIIEGGFSQQEVMDIIIQIKSGSLPAEVRVLEERVIGPTLGRDAIKSGTTAAIIGLIFVIIFILLYYRRAGIYAFVALVLNLIIIIGILSGIGAVLTLPGIAGFILTIGMAVDANVLIFERIREEIRAGTAPKNAVELGYKTAFVTIMDANITTFLAAFCLLLMGEGPIKGFAVMLMIGIVSSIFTAVFCSRTFFLLYMKRHPALPKLAIWPVWQNARPSTGN